MMAAKFRYYTYDDTFGEREHLIEAGYLDFQDGFPIVRDANGKITHILNEFTRVEPYEG